MKKILAWILLLALALSLAACGGSEQPAEKEQTETQETAETADPAAEETDGLAEIDKADLALDFNRGGAGDQIGKNAVRAGSAGGSNFDNLPPTEDQAAYLPDGRLQLTTGDVTIRFELPFGWIILTQDAEAQREDYEMYIADPAALVREMQMYGMNAAVLTADGEELDVFVDKSPYSQYLQESSNVTEHNVDSIVLQLKEANPEASDIYFAQIGDNTFAVFEFEEAGVVAFSTVCNGTEILILYSIDDSTTQEMFDAVMDFVGKLEVLPAA